MGDGIIKNFLFSLQHNVIIELPSSFHHFICDTLTPIKSPNITTQIKEVRKSISKTLVLLYTGSIIIEGAHSEHENFVRETCGCIRIE